MSALVIVLLLVIAAVLAFPARSVPARRLAGFSERPPAVPVAGNPNRPGSSGAHGRPDGAPAVTGGRLRRWPLKGAGSLARQPGLRDPAMVLELVAAMLEAGSGLGRALDLIAAAAAEEIRAPLRPVVAALAIGADWETAWRSSDARHPDILLLRDALSFAAFTGAPSASILYAQAARIRRDRFRQAEKRAASLGVKLVIPLGLCSLPAFICLGVVPVLLALVPSGG
ncbi:MULTISPECIES: type II secretion system F family protein [unclassified Pseudarthrobacter]|uniref:type II secretion system F family protein n=1 Tax=unclassified Pseudarthrobacter TaxID=2647000 RepID=UPI003CC67224